MLLDPLPASADVALRLCQQGHAQTIQTLRHVLTETHIVTGDLICPASRTRYCKWQPRPRSRSLFLAQVAVSPAASRAHAHCCFFSSRGFGLPLPRFPIVNGVPNFVDDQLHAKARSLQADRASSAMQESGQESAAE